MKYSREEIIELERDPLFLNELDKLEVDGKASGDIEKLYDVLDSLLLFEGDHKSRVNIVYEAILEEALKNLHSKLEDSLFFDLNTSKDHLSLRAIYEYAIELYSSKKVEEAKELFIMLSILTENNVFKGAMQIHLVSILKEVEFQDFIHNFVDMEKMDSSNESYFILYFKDVANQFLHQNSSLILEAIQEVRKKGF